MRPHVFQVRELTRVWWVILDGVFVLTGQTEEDARARWVWLVGRPAGGFLRVLAPVRPDELLTWLMILRSGAEAPAGESSPAPVPEGGAP